MPKESCQISQTFYKHSSSVVRLVYSQKFMRAVNGFKHGDPICVLISCKDLSVECTTSSPEWLEPICELKDLEFFVGLMAIVPFFKQCKLSNHMPLCRTYTFVPRKAFLGRAFWTRSFAVVSKTTSFCSMSTARRCCVGWLTLVKPTSLYCLHSRFDVSFKLSAKVDNECRMTS
jgi:hypothetical protein